MSPEEVRDLLKSVAARDNRRVLPETIAAWLEDLSDLDLFDAREAVHRHFRDSTDWIMPAHIRRHVKAIRAERLVNSGPLVAEGLHALDPVDTPAAYRNAMNAITRTVGDGQPPPFRAINTARAITGPRDTSTYRKDREQWDADQRLKRQQARAERDARITADIAARDAQRRAMEASAALILLTDEAALDAYALARAELGDAASRDDLMIRAAELADHTQTRPVPTDGEHLRDTAAKRGCRHGCEIGYHEHPCPQASADSPVGYVREAN